MRIAVRSFLFVLVLSFPVAIFGQEQSPAEKRARELVEFFNTGNRTTFREYVLKNFGGNFRDLPMDMHLSFYSSEKDQSRGFEVLGATDVEANRVALRVRSKLTGEISDLLVRVEGESPHRIVGIGTRPSRDDSGQGAKLTEKEIASRLSAFVEKLANADVFSGSVLLAKGDKVVFKGAYGMANKDFGAANRIDTKFNLGSMNKMFTALAIAKLVESGKLTVEDSLSKFIEDFPDKESAKKIKVKHLLSHTSGLGGYFSSGWRAKSRASIRTVDDMMAQAREDERLQFQPGSRRRYSNTGILVLGKIVEVVSGEDYFKFVDKNILGPAGMKNTGCFELDRVNKNLAVGYDKVFGDDGYTFQNNIFMHVMRGGPHGGCYSTAEDLLRFSRAVSNNRIVNSDLTKQFTTPKPDLGSPRYGFGFATNEAGTVFGHGGGFTGISANLDVFRDSGWTAIVLANYSRASGPVSRKMRTLIAAAER